MKVRSVAVARAPVHGTVRVPGSKSMTNRALVLGALAAGSTVIDAALFSDDTLHMVGGLQALGLRVEAEPREERFTVWGAGGQIPAAEASIDAGDAGTVARFLTAVAALGRGRYVIDGSPRMRERPIGDLVGALRALGADASDASGYPPVVLRAAGLAGGRASVRGAASSQFLSALLQVAPCADAPVELTVDGPLAARPYVDLTLRLMKDFGVTVARDGYRWFAASPAPYRATRIAVEPDASAASYFLALAAIAGGRVMVLGLRPDSTQGDVGFIAALEAMGCRVRWTDAGVEVEGASELRGLDLDMSAMPDMVPTLAAVAPFARGSVRIRNVAHIRGHESDRLRALAVELRRLGQDVHEAQDGLEILPHPVRPAVLDTHSDHRLAMAFALIGARIEGIGISNPECVSKTFPDFFSTLDALLAGRSDPLESPR